MNATAPRPAPSILLRKDHDDPDRFHLIQREWYPWTFGQWRPTHYVIASFHGDSLPSVFGEVVAARANDELDKGESMPLVISATCPDDNSVLTDQPNEGSTIISNAEAIAILAQQTV